MDITDYIRSAALVLSFLLLVSWDRRIWMTADMLASVGFGAAFVFVPNLVLDFQVEGKLDSLHLQLAQILGVTLACSAIVWYFTRDTRDGTVPITLMMSRIFSCGVMLLAMVYTQWLSPKTKGKWTDQHIYFGMVGCALWMLGNLIHLLRSSDFSTYPQHNIRINSHLRVDAWLVITVSLLNFAFPDFVISYLAKDARPDGIHLHLARVLGVQGFGSAIVSLQAPGFLHEHDKRYQFLERLLTYVAVLTLGGWQMFWLGSYSKQMLYTSLISMSPILVNSVLGYFAGGTIMYKFKRN